MSQHLALAFTHPSSVCAQSGGCSRTSCHSWLRAVFVRVASLPARLAGCRRRGRSLRRWHRRVSVNYSLPVKPAGVSRTFHDHSVGFTPAARCAGAQHGAADGDAFSLRRRRKRSARRVGLQATATCWCRWCGQPSPQKPARLRGGPSGLAMVNSKNTVASACRFSVIDCSDGGSLNFLQPQTTAHNRPA